MTFVQGLLAGVDELRHKAHLFKIRNPFIYESIKFLFFSFFIILFVARGLNGLNYRWQWYRMSDYIYEITENGISAGPLLSGLRLTLFVSAVSLILSVVIGFVSALFRLSESVTAVIVSRVYLEAVRNTPLLIQLFLIYFVVSPILGIGRMLSAILALSLFEGAYTSEIIRSGIISIEKGQWEAAHSIGLSRVQTYRRVILPQAFRQVLPMLASQAISLVKDSALVSTIAIYELTMHGQVAISESFLTFEIWFTVAAIYLIINSCLSLIIHIFERRMNKVSI
ncbi:MAG TPA: polar amino acid ABC transporter permease [Spirochaeta sp.]|nr:polar amino acid ABC transporter permease [Spirochaeta sp.]